MSKSLLCFIQSKHSKWSRIDSREADPKKTVFLQTNNGISGVKHLLCNLSQLDLQANQITAHMIAAHIIKQLHRQTIEIGIY